MIKFISIGAVNFYFILMLMVDHNLSSSLATLLMIGSFSIMIIGAPVLGKLADKRYLKIKAGKVDMMIFLLILGPIFYILAFSFEFELTNVILFILFIVLILLGSFFLSGDNNIAQSIYGDINPPHLRSTVISIQTIFTRIGMGLGVFLTGFFFNIFSPSARIAF